MVIKHDDASFQGLVNQKLSVVQNCAYSFTLCDFSSSRLILDLIHQVKYKSDRNLGVELGTLLAKYVNWDLLSDYDLLIPVPLHKTRLKVRGFNQSEVIAKALIENTTISLCTNVVIRKIATTTQTAKTKIDRHINMQKVFQIIDNQVIKNKKIIILDDVITTGATIISLCEEINKQGARSIAVITLASGAS